MQSAFPRSNIQTASVRKEAQKENEVARIGALGERTEPNKLKWSNFSQIQLRKVSKSMKSEHQKLARSEFRSFFPSLFRNEAETEQLAAEKAVFEQFDLNRRRVPSMGSGVLKFRCVHEKRYMARQ